MSPLLLVMTLVLWAIPPVFMIVPYGRPLAIGMIAMYALVWLVGRPTRFEISPDSLSIVWPLRRRVIPRADISGVRYLSRAALKEEVGYAMRFGVGGLWGGFGRAWTGKGTMELWISRQDWCVLVERRSGMPLILTPERPEAFTHALAPR